MRLFSRHLDREMPIYAFCGTLAAKVKLTKAIPSTETGIWPDGRPLDEFSSGERQVWPDENVLRPSRSRQTFFHNLVLNNLVKKCKTDIVFRAN